MQLWNTVLQLSLLAFTAAPTAAASAWGFTDATVSVQTKGAGVGSGLKEKIPDNKALTKPVSLGGADTLKVTLTAREGSSGKRAHQVFLLLQDSETGLDISYPFDVKDNGKSKVELTQKDLPIQFLSLAEPLDAKLLIGSFGSAEAYNGAAFKLAVTRNPDQPVPTVEGSKYGKLPEIHHIFKEDPRSPPIVITLAFVAMVLATLPILAGVWLLLGANVCHLPKALKASPISHGVFLGSLLSIEGIFFLYYQSWTLFQILPPVAVAGTVAFISGSRALGEYRQKLSLSPLPHASTFDTADSRASRCGIRSAAQAVSRRQYPKQPTALPSTPSKPPSPGPVSTPRPPKEPETKTRAPSGPVYHSKEQPSLTKSNAIDLDGRDPDFAASLRGIGPVSPTPTLSNSSTFASGAQRGDSIQTVFPRASNPALLVVTARQKIAKAAEQEVDMLGRPGFAGREYLDALTIRQALSMRDRQGLPSGEIERLLRLKRGVVDRLGKKGLVSEVG
ncbi:Oligosaccharyltransferase subunit Ribophorin II-domain-containing protein [Aspergillus bertholletiae]|uniref:Oligosaccharyltransferase subunit Ribophorin II-domain-containing protein n=1 Tax=Aspergillus bertholletiae TaxID=1226010 RepID=A0A5N7BGP5_9EURO|nr:Oligosaccharyltransferase subunit Ribophorin II-domain-containing protein [Aspergillus bertholletiae]